jgi:hypothetical protein
VQRTSTTQGLKICPSSEDFVSGTDFGRTPDKQGQDDKTGRADEDNADGANRWIKQARRNKPYGNYLADGGRFLRWTLGRCYGGLCALAVVERLDEKL